MPPKEYNLRIYNTFDGDRKHWEAYNEKFITKLMDNTLENVIDISTILFDYIQDSRKPCGKIDIPPLLPLKAATAPVTPGTVATSRHLERELQKLATSGGSAVPSDDDEDEQEASASASQPQATGKKTALLPLMLSDPKYGLVWAKALQQSSMGDMLEHQKSVCVGLLAAHNKSYNNKKAMDVTTDADLLKLQRGMLGQIQRNINHQIVCSVWASCLDNANNSATQDAIRGIITTKEFKDVSLGKVFDPQWAWDPWAMPGVRLHMGLLYHFENLQEASNVNLILSVLQVMEAAQTANVYYIIDMFDRAVDPVAHTFEQVEDFIGYFKASLQYEVVLKKAKAKGHTCRAW